jgi:hypothetical protein
MFLNNYRRNYDGNSIGNSVGKSVGKSVGNKKYYYRGIYRRNGANKFIFLLPTDLPTEKKLLTKDSPTEHFRR